MKRDLLAIPPRPPHRRVSYGMYPNQFIDLWIPEHSRGLVMMIHGGFWRAKYDLSHTSHLCERLAALGLTVGNIEYRRIGNHGGGWPGSYTDVRRAWQALRKDFPGDRSVVIGHSAGGHLALRLAVDEPELSRVLALAPVAVLHSAYDLHLSHDAAAEFIGGTPAEKPVAFEDACPSRHPSSVARILLHGTVDDTVPLSMSEQFVMARRNDPGRVTLTKISGAGHFDLVDPESQSWTHVANALEGTSL